MASADSDALPSLHELQRLLQAQLEASKAEANGLARCCAHAERLLEKTRPAHSASEDVGQELDFDLEKWWQWRQLRSKWAQVKSQEPLLREAAKKARSTWKQQLLESSARTRTSSQETVGQFLKASMLARLCSLAVEEVLPAPEQFFIAKGLWPDRGDEQILEFCRLFLYIALERWLARLRQEAAKEVPPAAMAIMAIKAIKQRVTKREERESPWAPSVRREERELHPLSLLQLPGGEPAVRAILQAKYKAQQMEVETEIMRICCGPLEGEGATESSLLDEVSGILRDESSLGKAQPEKFRKALELLRLAQHLCSERRLMLSYWPFPDLTSSDPATGSEEVKKVQLCGC